MGGSMQLIAYGAQDIYLTGKPQLTFFKAVYRRHTNFAMESISQTISGSGGFGSTSYITLGRYGDLVGAMYLETNLPTPTGTYPGPGTVLPVNQGYMQNVGSFLIEEIEINIGGQLIDKQYGLWMDMWSELSLDPGKESGYPYMVAKNSNVLPSNPYDITDNVDNRLFIPLQFWFCRNPGLALPLVSLQYQEVQLKMKFANFNKLVFAMSNAFEYVDNSYLSYTGAGPTIVKFFAEYYFLDTQERQKFAQNAHEYLVEQLQYPGPQPTTSTNSNNVMDLHFNHPVKELVWAYQRTYPFAPQNDYSMGYNDAPNAAATPSLWAPLNKCKLIFNSKDRFKERHGEYFRIVQPYEHHTRTPNYYVYSYSFAIRPEEHQPSGSCNFSRIDDVKLQFSFRSTGTQVYTTSTLPNLCIFAVNYNVLRIDGGAGGLAYSN